MSNTLTDFPSSPLEPEPEIAEQIFGDSIEKIRQYTQMLYQEGELRGLIGSLEPARLWTRHIINSGLLIPYIHGKRVGDIGSGAGLPGIVLAIALPDTEFFLIEPMARRTEWLTVVKDTLGLHNVTVLRARAEEVSAELEFDQVTARAVSALKNLLPLTTHLLSKDGELVLLKGERIHEEISAAQKQLKKFTDVEVIETGAEYGTEVTRIFRARLQ